MTTTQELLESSFELNLSNYGPEDVERLNDWAIKAHNALEALQAEVKHLNLHLKATQNGRDAALARLAITEEANSMLLARNKWLEHTLEVAGASPVEPSLARAVEPVVRYEPERYAEDRVRMALDSDGDWVRYSDYLIAFATPQAAAQPPAPGEAAREYMTGYSDGREWAGATSQAQPSQALELSEAIENLIDATEGLMTWQVKNVKVWNNGAYDTAHMRVEQLRAAINAKERAAHGIKQGGQQ